MVGWRERIPDGYSVQPIDIVLARELQDLLVAAGNEPWFDNLWGSVEGFVENGFGFVAIGPGGIASNSRACWIKDGVAPIQVSTRGFARSRGLGTAVCFAFIEHCQAIGLTPSYSCESENLASIALAGKLGFRESGCNPTR